MLIKTIKEAIELLKKEKTLKYFHGLGTVVISTGFNSHFYIHIVDFLNMRASGFINCGEIKHDAMYFGGRIYQEYTLA